MCNQSLIVSKTINCLQKNIIYIYIGRPIRLIRLFNKPKPGLFNLIGF